MTAAPASAPARPLVNATLVGTLLQLAMVISGHYAAEVQQLFAPLGMALSLVAGLLYARWARPGTAGVAVGGGAAAGGVCAFAGILVSYLFGDVPAAVLGFGTASSAVAGAVGGLIGRLLARRTA
ncbi:MAG TPA: hypothetical protein VFK09_00305 [Gemmatimonadales bacterium]|nr:hypothetical protein [Gemmatimonadales bacterium]